MQEVQADTQPAPSNLRPSLAFQYRDHILCTACGGIGEAQEMMVWYVNTMNKPWGPGKGKQEIHHIHNRERCIAKANTQKGAHS